MREGQVGALVLAGGRGERLGSAVPKAFVPIGGVPMLVRSIEALGAVPRIDRIQPVFPERHPELALPSLQGRVASPTQGGAERQDSVAAGLAALGDAVDWVVVHDAARCLVAAQDVLEVIDAAFECDAAILAAPVTDTLKRAEGGVIAETLDRSACWAAQTPQVFRRSLLVEAHHKARLEGFVGTDDAQLVERLGAPVRVVASRAPNPKITHPGDLTWAESWLAGGEE